MSDLILRYPCVEGWDSQTFKSTHKGLDFGWCGTKGNGHTEIQACADGVVEFEGYYKQTFSNGVYKPIGVIIRHTQFSNEYDYISIYWHLQSTCINKGDTIKEGQKIGIKGNTGFSGGVHLHFQLLKIAKGAEIPDQHYPSKNDAWGKVSINPISLLRVHDDQYFLSKGNFTLQKYEQETTSTTTDYKAKCEELQTQIYNLTNELENAKTSLKTCEEKLAKIKEAING